MRVRIVSKTEMGSRFPYPSTEVIDLDTGKPIGGVVSIHFGADATSIPELTIKLIPTELIIESDTPNLISADPLYGLDPRTADSRGAMLKPIGEAGPPRDLGRFNCAGKYVHPGIVHYAQPNWRTQCGRQDANEGRTEIVGNVTCQFCLMAMCGRDSSTAEHPAAVPGNASSTLVPCPPQV